MKRHLIFALAVATILGAALAAVAQQDDARRQRWQRWQQAQERAIGSIQQDAAKLKVAMDEATRAMQNRSRWESLSEEERTRLREAWRKRREEWVNVLTDIETQVTLLKGPRQIRAEQEEAVAELKAVLDLARQENAPKTAERVEALIETRRAKYQERLEKIGIER